MPGIVANVPNHIFRSGSNILESQQYNDMETNRFFMRTAYRFADPAGSAALEDLVRKDRDIERRVLAPYRLPPRWSRARLRPAHGGVQRLGRATNADFL
jgi:formyltetrahydrofolate hydrolase